MCTTVNESTRLRLFRIDSKTISPFSGRAKLLLSHKPEISREAATAIRPAYCCPVFLLWRESEKNLMLVGNIDFRPGFFLGRGAPTSDVPLRLTVVGAAVTVVLDTDSGT